MSKFLLEVDGLEVAVRRKPIVSKVTFSLQAGEILGLFGNSGSGKTTILHSLTGLLDPQYQVQGKIRFCDRQIELLPPDVRSRLGMSIVMQDLGLFADRSVFENVAYPLRQRGVDEKQTVSEVQSTLEFLHISDLAERRPGELSGGQRQRTALARAVVYRPRLLLLDEPLRGLEAELRLQFLAFVRAIGSKGTAVIFVSHDRQELSLVSDTVVTIAGGVIVGQESFRPGNAIASLQPTVLLPNPSGVGYIKASGLRVHAGGAGHAPANTIDVIVSC